MDSMASAVITSRSAIERSNYDVQLKILIVGGSKYFYLAVSVCMCLVIRCSVHLISVSCGEDMFIVKICQ